MPKRGFGTQIAVFIAFATLGNLFSPECHGLDWPRFFDAATTEQAGR
jgi:hypothetical protein